MSLRPHGLLVCASVLLAACAGEVPLGQPDLGADEIQASAEGIRRPGTTRAAVHEALGESWLATTRRDAEVFRLSGKQHRMMLVFAPYPVPLPMPGERLESYTLVNYSGDGTVAAVDAGFTRSEAFGRTQGLLLRAGAFEFLHGSSDTLSVALEDFRQELAAVAPRNACAVIMGCERAADAAPLDRLAGDVCFTRVEVDGAQAVELSMVQQVSWPLDGDATEARPTAEQACRDAGGRITNTLCFVDRRLLHPLLLDPGRHSLRFTSRHLAGEADGEFECVSGAVVFATLRGQLTESYSMSRQLSARLKVGAATVALSFSEAAPERIRSQNVILFVDGAYLLRRQAQP